MQGTQGDGGGGGGGRREEDGGQQGEDRGNWVFFRLCPVCFFFYSPKQRGQLLIPDKRLAFGVVREEMEENERGKGRNVWGGGGVQTGAAFGTATRSGGGKGSELGRYKDKWLRANEAKRTL
ncbi:hypothetical protein JOB18_013288 [Solea senegalensis]|uniref:Uncharacterized protein n=1 Tax=Solea senegalensis TaxID=28829 RepID=A0AAV6QSW4_SOLSE|nr:hypothetical protein JOB18_013288 [Solea senegalensis]